MKTLSVLEFSRLKGIPPGSIYALIAHGRLEHVKTILDGGKTAYRIPEDAVLPPRAPKGLPRFTPKKYEGWIRLREYCEKYGHDYASERHFGISDRLIAVGYAERTKGGVLIRPDAGDIWT